MLAVLRIRALKRCHDQARLLRSLGRYSRAFQTQTQSYQDAKINNIRNIGIIAHVDAVRIINPGLPAPPAVPYHRESLMGRPMVGEDYDNGAYALPQWVNTAYRKCVESPSLLTYLPS